MAVTWGPHSIKRVGAFRPLLHSGHTGSHTPTSNTNNTAERYFVMNKIVETKQLDMGYKLHLRKLPRLGGLSN